MQAASLDSLQVLDGLERVHILEQVRANKAAEELGMDMKKGICEGLEGEKGVCTTGDGESRNNLLEGCDIFSVLTPTGLANYETRTETQAEEQNHLEKHLLVMEVDVKNTLFQAFLAPLRTGVTKECFEKSLEEVKTLASLNSEFEKKSNETLDILWPAEIGHVSQNQCYKKRLKRILLDVRARFQVGLAGRKPHTWQCLYLNNMGCNNHGCWELKLFGHLQNTNLVLQEYEREATYRVSTCTYFMPNGAKHIPNSCHDILREFLLKHFSDLTRKDLLSHEPLARLKALDKKNQIRDEIFFSLWPHLQRGLFKDFCEDETGRDMVQFIHQLAQKSTTRWLVVQETSVPSSRGDLSSRMDFPFVSAVDLSEAFGSTQIQSLIGGRKTETHRMAALVEHRHSRSWLMEALVKKYQENGPVQVWAGQTSLSSLGELDDEECLGQPFCETLAFSDPYNLSEVVLRMLKRRRMPVPGDAGWILFRRDRWPHLPHSAEFPTTAKIENDEYDLGMPLWEVLRYSDPDSLSDMVINVLRRVGLPVPGDPDWAAFRRDRWGHLPMWSSKFELANLEVNTVDLQVEQQPKDMQNSMDSEQITADSANLKSKLLGVEESYTGWKGVLDDRSSWAELKSAYNLQSPELRHFIYQSGRELESEVMNVSDKEGLQAPISHDSDSQVPQLGGEPWHKFAEKEILNIMRYLLGLQGRPSWWDEPNHGIIIANVMKDLQKGVLNELQIFHPIVKNRRPNVALVQQLGSQEEQKSCSYLHSLQTAPRDASDVLYIKWWLTQLTKMNAKPPEFPDTESEEKFHDVITTFYGVLVDSLRRIYGNAGNEVVFAELEELVRTNDENRENQAVQVSPQQREIPSGHPVSEGDPGVRHEIADTRSPLEERVMAATFKDWMKRLCVMRAKASQFVLTDQNNNLEQSTFPFVLRIFYQRLASEGSVIFRSLDKDVPVLQESTVNYRQQIEANIQPLLEKEQIESLDDLAAKASNQVRDWIGSLDHMSHQRYDWSDDHALSQERTDLLRALLQEVRTTAEALLGAEVARDILSLDARENSRLKTEVSKRRENLDKQHQLEAKRQAEKISLQQAGVPLLHPPSNIHFTIDTRKKRFDTYATLVDVRNQAFDPTLQGFMYVGVSVPRAFSQHEFSDFKVYLQQTFEELSRLQIEFVAAGLGKDFFENITDKLRRDLKFFLTAYYRFAAGQVDHCFPECELHREPLECCYTKTVGSKLNEPNREKRHANLIAAYMRELTRTLVKYAQERRIHLRRLPDFSAKLLRHWVKTMGTSLTKEIQEHLVTETGLNEEQIGRYFRKVRAEIRQGRDAMHDPAAVRVPRPPPPGQPSKLKAPGNLSAHDQQQQIIQQALIDWLEQHKEYPFMIQSEKIKMSKITGLSLGKIEAFCNEYRNNYRDRLNVKFVKKLHDNINKLGVNAHKTFGSRFELVGAPINPLVVPRPKSPTQTKTKTKTKTPRDPFPRPAELIDLKDEDLDNDVANDSQVQVFQDFATSDNPLDPDEQPLRPLLPKGTAGPAKGPALASHPSPGSGESSLFAAARTIVTGRRDSSRSESSRLPPSSSTVAPPRSPSTREQTETVQEVLSQSVEKGVLSEKEAQSIAGPSDVAGGGEDTDELSRTESMEEEAAALKMLPHHVDQLRSVPTIQDLKVNQIEREVWFLQNSRWEYPAPEADIFDLFSRATNQMIKNSQKMWAVATRERCGAQIECLVNAHKNFANGIRSHCRPSCEVKDDPGPCCYSERFGRFEHLQGPLQRLTATLLQFDADIARMNFSYVNEGHGLSRLPLYACIALEMWIHPRLQLNWALFPSNQSLQFLEKTYGVPVKQLNEFVNYYKQHIWLVPCRPGTIQLASNLPKPSSPAKLLVRSWFEANCYCPYLRKRDSTVLCAATGLSYEQITVQLKKIRRNNMHRRLPPTFEEQLYRRCRFRAYQAGDDELEAKNSQENEIDFD